MEFLYYKCLANGNKTYIENYPLNQFTVECLPGGKWHKPADADWPICLDSTTTTLPPTTTSPLMRELILHFYKYGNMGAKEDLRRYASFNHQNALLVIAVLVSIYDFNVLVVVGAF